MDQDKPTATFIQGSGTGSPTNPSLGFSYDESIPKLGRIAVKPIPNAQPYHLVSENTHFQANLPRRKNTRKQGKEKIIVFRFMGHVFIVIM